MMQEVMKKDIQSDAILLSKGKTRKEIAGKLISQDKEQILNKSAVVKKKLFELEEFKKAKCVIFYASMATEVNTHEMIDESIKMGKVVGVPAVFKGEKDLIISQIMDRTKQFENGPYGISQPTKESVKPIPYDKIDLLLVPGIAFDKNGNRLGRGKGYYDRLLEKLPTPTVTIGLCFDFQVVKSIPKLPHDIPVKMLLSDA